MAGQLVPVWWRGTIKTGLRPASKGQECIGNARTSIPCLHCVILSVTVVGRRCGKRLSSTTASFGHFKSLLEMNNGHRPRLELATLLLNFLPPQSLSLLRLSLQGQQNHPLLPLLLLCRKLYGPVQLFLPVGGKSIGWRIG